METVISGGGHAAALWTSLNLLLLVLLSGLVVRQRNRLKVAFGDAGSAELLRASCALATPPNISRPASALLAVLALVGVQSDRHPPAWAPPCSSAGPAMRWA